MLGIHHASELTVKRYDAVQVAKDGGGRDSLRVVLIADLHLGYSVGAKRIEDMVEKVNAQDADIVLIAGDIFDNTVDGIDDPESVKASLRVDEKQAGRVRLLGQPRRGGAPVQRVQHQKAGKHPAQRGRWSGSCATAASSMLADEARLIDDSFYVIGRKDYENAGDGTARAHEPCGELMAGYRQGQARYFAGT